VGIEQKFKYGVSFDGENDYVQVLDSPSLTFNNQITITAWIKPTLHPSGWYDIVGKSNSEFRFVVHSDGSQQQLVFLVSDDEATWSYAVSGLGTLKANEWQFVAVTFDSGNVTFYINGEKYVKTIDRTTIFDSSNALKIGWYYETYYFDGLIDEVRIYNRALSDSEIKWNYQNPDDPITDGLVLWLDARTYDPSTGIWYDLSGQDNHGTAYGNPQKVRLVDEEVIVK